MLGKLTKYELKSTVNTFLLIYGAVLVLAVLNRIFYSFDYREFYNYGEAATSLSWIGGMLTGIFTTIYVLMIVAMFVAVTISVIMRFYKNMFGSEGYLMHTLPVKPWEHIVSKMLASSVWMLGSFVVTALSVFVLLTHPEAFRVLSEGWREFVVVVRDVPFNWTPIIIECVIVFIMAVIGWQLPIYASICIGQLWGKHRILGAFIAYFIISTVTQIISGFAVAGSSFNFARAMENANYHDEFEIMTLGMNYFHTIMVISIVLSLLFMAAYFVISNHIMTRKLDLE